MPAPAAAYTAAYRGGVLLLLMLVYTLNSADRNLIPIVGQAMKADLKLTDTELGLLAGTAFAALYALSGVPLARLAERFSRVTILSAALALWSALTALFGLAGSFAQLVAVRVGVGIGEAGCAPCAHSLISDYYERARRTSALSVYSCGLSLGYLFVSVVGGYVTRGYGWRMACLIVGLPGLAVALLLRALVAEPARGLADGVTPPAPAPFAVRAELAELAAAARTLFLARPALNIILGFTLSSFVSYGAWAFIPAYFRRAFGLDYGTLGLALGLVGSVPVALGTLAGGFLSDWLGKKSARWYALVPAAGLLAATPFYLATLLQGNWKTAALLLSVPGFFQYISLAPSFGVVQNVVSARQRATATALLFLCLNVLALGGGALFTGFVIDRLAQGAFAFPQLGPFAGLWHGLTVAAPTASFRAACPGGAAPAGATPLLISGCAQALEHATRAGLLLTFTLHLWAAAHYLRAAPGLGRQLARAQELPRGA